MINLRGFSMRYSLYGTTSTVPVMVHFAVLAHKGQTVTPAATQDQAIQDDDFFRGNGVARAIGFDVSLSGIQFNTLLINQDNYAVLKRWSHKVSTSSATAEAGMGEKYIQRKLWVPVNRQVRYDDPGHADVATSGRLFWVWWAEYVAGIPSSGTAVADQARLDAEVIMYYRDSY